MAVWIKEVFLGDRGSQKPKARLLEMCMGGVYVLQMQLVLRSWWAGLGEEVVRYNWLVGKLIIPPCVCTKLILNTTGKRIFLVTTNCA